MSHIKLHLSNRELLLAITTGISLLLVIVAGVYAMHVKHAADQKEQSANTLIEGKDNLLRQKDTGSNETANYVETICAEYRKLYGAYSVLRSQNPSSGVSYSIPGSAKGNIDECYQPE